MLEQPSAKTLVLGVGNLLMCDEGVGVHVVRRLANTHHFPMEEVLILDGGTLGMDLLYYLQGIENLLIVDAVDAGQKPGGVIRLEGEEVPSFLSMKISPHQIGIPDMLFAAKLTECYPSNVVLWGVQPERMEIGLEMSSTVASQVDDLVQHLVDQLNEWGHSPLSLD